MIANNIFNQESVIKSIESDIIGCVMVDFVANIEFANTGVFGF